MFTRRQIMAVAAAFLLLMVVYRLLPDRQDVTVQRERIDVTRVQHPSGQMQNIRGSQMMHLEIDPSNNRLVSKLNHDPEIQIISHNREDESHYYEHEATVKFKTVPDAEKLKQMEKEMR